MAKWFQCKCSPDEIMLLTREALSKSLVCREVSSERTATIMHSWHCLGGGPRRGANPGWGCCSSQCLARCVSTSEGLNSKHRHLNEMINSMNKNVGTSIWTLEMKKSKISLGCVCCVYYIYIQFPKENTYLYMYIDSTCIYNIYI